MKSMHLVHVHFEISAVATCDGNREEGGNRYVHLGAESI